MANETQTTEELRAAAVAAEKQPETPAPATPDPNEPYTIVEGENGLLELKLRTGEVFKGTALEVAKTIAKSKVDTTDYSKDLKAELTALKASTQHIQDALTPKPPAPSEEEVQQKQLQDFLLEAHAQGLGYSNAGEYRQELIGIRETTEKSRADRIALDFIAECPEFPATDQNSKELMKVLADAGVIHQLPNGNYTEPTVAQLVMGHAFCVQTEKYKPLTEAEIQQQINAGMKVKPKMQLRPNPPPMVPGTQPENTPSSQPPDLWKEDLGEMRARLIREQRQQHQ